MAEKSEVFSSKVKYKGIFSFADYYQFCYDWMDEEMGLSVKEKKYAEKISGDEKEVEVEWSGDVKFTDYFKWQCEVKMKITNMKNVEVNRGGVKERTNQGTIEMSIKGTLIRDYDGKFEDSATKKFWRGIYEKWVIPSRVSEFSGKVVGLCDTFLGQAKAYLDLEGKR